MKTIDLRYQSSEDNLKEALLRLLEKKSISKVSVKELCSEANVNRSTFYAHFKDIEEVFIKIQSDVFSDLSMTIQKNQSTLSLNSIHVYRAVLEFVKRNQKPIKLTLIGNQNSPYIVRMVEMGKTTFCDLYLNQIDRKKEEIEYFYYFIANGFIGIITKWVCNGCSDSIDDVSRFAKKIVYSILRTMKTAK